MAMPATPEPDREASAYLAAARKLRHALTERDKVVGPHRERYDRSQDDLRMMPEKRVKIAGEFMRDSEAAKRGLASLKRAVTEGRRSLFVAYATLKRDPDQDAALEGHKAVLADCLANLAAALMVRSRRQPLARQRRFWLLIRARAFAKQAVRLQPSRAELHFCLAVVRDERRTDSGVIRAFRSACEIDPENGEYWAYLARAYATSGNDPEARAAVARVCASPSSASPDSLAVAAEVFTDPKESARVASMQRFKRQLEESIANGEPAGEDFREALRKRIADESWEGMAWEKAQGLLLMSEWSHEASDKERCLRAAIDLLKTDHFEEIRSQGLLGHLAQVVLDQGRPAEALKEAQRAVALDPLSHYERSVVAYAYEALHDYDAAHRTWEEAIRRESDDPRIYVGLADSCFELALATRDPARRSELLNRTSQHVAEALDLFEPDDADGRAWAHGLLGRLELALGKFDQAVASFSMMRELQPDRLHPRFYLAIAHLKNKSFDEAARHFERMASIVGEGMPEQTVDVDADGRRGSRGDVLVRSRLGRARVRMSKGLDDDSTVALVRQAKQHLSRRSYGRIVDQELEAECLQMEGWVLMETGGDRLDQAIQRLKRSASLASDPETYLRLALAYERKADTAEAPGLPVQLSRARSFWRLARETDTFGEHSEELQEVGERLDARTGSHAGS